MTLENQESIAFNHCLLYLPSCYERKNDIHWQYAQYNHITIILDDALTRCTCAPICVSGWCMLSSRALNTQWLTSLMVDWCRICWGIPLRHSNTYGRRFLLRLLMLKEIFVWKLVIHVFILNRWISWWESSLNSIIHMVQNTTIFL